jgi:NAD+ kinase
MFGKGSSKNGEAHWALYKRQRIEIMSNLMSNYSYEIQEGFEEMEERVKACPKCRETENLGIERSPQGDSFCSTCGYKDKHKTFYVEKSESKVLYIDPYDENKKIIDKGDYIVAKGGDGTLLKAINKFRHLNKPFFGVAAGTKNFLMNSEDEVSNSAKYKKFTMLKVKVTYENPEYPITSTTEEFQAFNEVFISEENGWIDFDCYDRDYILGKFKGSGLIISTPQGSTGINKNNNGVILPLSSKDWSITGDKTNRKINYVLRQKKISIAVKSRGSVNVFIDGNNNKIKNSNKIEISKGDSVIIIFNDYYKFKRKRI